MKQKIAVAALAAALLLSACSFGSSAQDRLAGAVTGIQDEEKPFLEAQEDMAGLEKKEFDLFKSMMELSKEDSEKLSAMVKEADESVGKRLSLLDQGDESVANAEKKLSGLDDVKTDDKNAEKAVGELKEAMESRYAAQNDYSSLYREAADLQKKLYGMLTDEKADFKEIQEQADQVNAKHSEVRAALSEFNQATERLNELKAKAFDVLDANDSK
ncbi:YkyA family protein [Edaphobacillus lindanitolerans]|uniref:Putative cell-wall binding lipoprotein n=1 Tax=Edaphobacillus lindanitolerans TaxID=550447 RepID=A0A1U7PLC2_9BACI|nr:YkyA family protein [Edaphobacillus lindanitolerans]SIT68221.1 Putative cell-wall binding lipoprotein [Edaphobacillus lindanitolerans]